LEGLTAAGIATVGDVVAKAPEELLAISGFGESALEELKSWLLEKGIPYGQPVEEAEPEPALAAVDLETVLNLTVADLPLSEAGKAALIEAGFTTVSDMVGVPTQTLLEIEGFTREDLEAFSNHLLSLGVLYDTGEGEAEVSEEGAEAEAEAEA
ncbi:MAG TPA: DNA-directed RNA polymerase subunit alpha C-terminal domain-containing protein, partial [bacterium]|nr:DNA-directed RNA polymerase subunit alpha C-terminal domain-containing protein [bacterium]